MIESLGGERDEFEAWWGDNLSVGGAGCAWDVPLIARLFPASAPTHGLSWDEAAMSVPAHCWIALDGRHHDAECPEGVGNLFELPIVRREMERLAAERDAAPAPGP